MTRPSRCVLCDRPLRPSADEEESSIGFCPSCAGELGMVPVLDLLHLTPEEADRLPFGLVVLDAGGTVLRFNHTEEQYSGLTAPEVMGRDFFSEVAPCTRVQEFAGRYREMVERNEDATLRFDFTFRFRGQERLVRIHLNYSPLLRTAILLVRERSHT